MKANRSIRQVMKSQTGTSLLETLIAAFILLFVLLSMISSYTLGRRDIDQEEIKRRATALAMDRLETVRSRYANEVTAGNGTAAWNNISSAQIDTTYTVDQTLFTLVSEAPDTVVINSVAQHTRKDVWVEVSWTAKKHNNASVTRKVRLSTSIGRMAAVGS